MRTQRLYFGLLGCVFALVLSGCVKSSQGRNNNHFTIKAVINYSVAPWDGSAYELLIPLKKVHQAPNPFIRINIWGNPEFQQPETLNFSGKNNSMETGHAIFQPILNDSLPEILTGTVYFATLKQGVPVSGTFNLSTSDGKTFKGQFQAAWGNKKPPYIR
ncbi:MAG: hypothetical protein WCA07_02665 [Gloeobacterales cyanobacterium]